MELYTLDRLFHKQNIIDGFTSVIWTERYYGDSAVELTVPATPEMVQKLPEGVFLTLAGSDEPMIIETSNVKGGDLKVSGIALLPWLNNRFIRSSDKHEDRYWYVGEGTAGWTLWNIVYSMCCAGSPYLDGTIPTGITNPEKLIIPGLGLQNYDDSGDIIKVAIPFGPVYDAAREIATTYEIGMQIVLEDVTDVSYSLGFRSYKGLDRTTSQTVNDPVRFSPELESFTNIEEIRSIAALKTLVYAFAPGLVPAEEGDPVLTTVPGVSALAGSEYVGFDLRALQVFAEDITTDQVAGSTATVVEVLNNRAHDALTNNSFVQAVDGEIVPDNQLKYGKAYNLGDIIEVQGSSGTIQTARVTEYIRSQDAAGEKAYPTVSMIG